jgi:hypothetical protein
MSAVMNFTLALRDALPCTSITLDPVFSLLYEDNKATLSHLVNLQKPLDLKQAFPNNKFMAWVTDNEPGPKVQYQNLRPALSAMKSWLQQSASGKDLIRFYRDFIQLHGKWALAAAQYVLFYIHCKLTQALYFGQGDAKLIAQITKYVPDAQDKINAVGKLDLEKFNLLVKNKKATLLAKAYDAGKELFDFKVTQTFCKQHAKLVGTIEATEKKMHQIRERNGRVTKLQQKRRALRQRNEANALRQMGATALSPQSSHVQTSVRQFVDEESNHYFDFNRASAGQQTSSPQP